MASKTPYHISQQYTYALLGPACLTLAELEHRAQAHLDHLNLQSDDREALQAAHEVLAAAYQQLSALHLSTRKPGA